MNKGLFDLKGSVAVVTGASSGLGVQMAKALASQGADLVILARRKEKLEKVAEEMGNDNTNQWNTMFPGFTYCVNGHDIDITYTRFNNEYNKEPFVIIRDFYGLGKPSEIEIVEEFRLINNLYFDREKNEYDSS